MSGNNNNNENFKMPRTPPEYEMQSPYVNDPTTGSAALPARPRAPTAMDKLYRTICCGSPVGVCMWVLGVIAVFGAVIAYAIIRANVRMELSHLRFG